MKQLGKKILAIVACVAMAVSVLPQGVLVYAAETVEYQIYPAPHSVKYEDDSFEISSDVNVVLESGIDEVTVDKLEDVLSEHGITMSESDKVSDSATNILVGIKDSNEYVDAYADENVTYSEETFAANHYDAYVLNAGNGTITILGADTDAAFYGIVSLMHILNQLDGNTIRNLMMEDYADTAIRGFIEGYYGIPWSNEDRMSLMEFGGQFKMTSYVFAPKDDPYHTSKWRELYPTEEINEIAEMVEVGNANKCRFVWTAHPFMGGFNSNDVDGEIEALLNKFDQLYSVGVRQFGVLGDDVGSLDREIVIRVMNAVSEWANEKGDVYDSVFCPAGYNHSWQGDYSELNDYDAGFPDNVQIFWTGEAVCQPVEQKTLDHFRNQNAADGERRSPLFWLNWPVNDINSARLMMGKGSLLHTDVEIDDLAGVVTNPMQEAEASKVALFAVADYAWNIRAFDDDQSWEDSFAYIDANASEELHTLAKHMSDPAPNGHGLVLEESEELNPLLTEYQTKLEAGTLTTADHEAMLAEFEEIVEACDGFHAKSTNENLKEELLPYTNALKDKALAAIEFIKTQQAIENGDESAAWSHYSQASAYLTSSQNYTKEILSGTSKVTPGSKRITPFLDKLNTTLSPIVITMIDDTKQFTTLITNREDTPDGALEKLTDNSEATEVIWKSPTNTTAGTYIGLAYSKAIELNSVVFKMGQSGNANDTFDAGKLQYTEDGKTWIDIEGTEFTTRTNEVKAENLDLLVKGVRIISTQDKTNMWLGCKEIVINGGSQEDTVSTYEGTVFVPSAYSVYSGQESNVTDGSDDTFIWYQTPNNTVSVGDYVGLDLGSEVSIGAIHFAMPSGDCLSNYTLQYSVDGTNYTDIETFTNLTADVDLSGQDITARYVRVKNNTNTGKWLKVAEFSVAPEVISTDAIFTNVEDLTGLSVNITEDTAVLTGSKEITLASGEYVGIELDRIKDVKAITAVGAGKLTLETSKNNVVWTEVTDDTYEDARYIRLVNNTDKDVKVDFESLTVESFEISPISVEGTNFGNESTHLYAFDQDRTTEAVLQASQIAGAYITYDLGQVIDLESLKVVLHDGTTDYPRHAKVSVSEDGATWTDVLIIGNQDSDNEGEAENTDNISDLFPVHEISYYTLEATDINENVRYIKFEITRNKSGADKWVRIREIELNGGNVYLPESNDPTIVTDAEESKGNTLTNMIDGDLSTIFQSTNNAAGTFTYSISENTEIKRITILQSPATISNAEVTAEVVEDGTVKTVKLGALTDSLNKFNTTLYDNVLAVTVTWSEGNVPGIHEIITLNTIADGEDKNALNDYYNEVKDTDTTKWTDESRKAFEDAVGLAEAVLADSYSSAEEISNAIAALKTAIENKAEKPDVGPEEPTEPENPAEPEEPTKPENPVEPEEPTEPENPTVPEDTDKEDKSPATGDASMIMFWFVMMIMAATVIAIRKREN